MTKRIRRDRRVIWVDSEKTAMDIEQFCVENKFVEGRYFEACTSCYASNITCEHDPTEWCVVFYCTLTEWNRISDHYNLKRLFRYKYSYDYELGLSS